MLPNLRESRRSAALFRLTVAVSESAGRAALAVLGRCRSRKARTLKLDLRRQICIGGAVELGNLVAPQACQRRSADVALERTGVEWWPNSELHSEASITRQFRPFPNPRALQIPHEVAEAVIPSRQSYFGSGSGTVNGLG